MVREHLPRFVSPMLARSGMPTDAEGWAYEVKFDGSPNPPPGGVSPESAAAPHVPSGAMSRGRDGLSVDAHVTGAIAHCDRERTLVNSRSLLVQRERVFASLGLRISAFHNTLVAAR
jgi:hypothetical protein